MVDHGPRRRVHALFSGRVQGVGFRFTVCQLAGEYAVTGYVRNLPDGNVEMVAEGSEQELSDLVRAVQESRPGRYIVGTHLGWEPPTGQYDHFGVAF